MLRTPVNQALSPRPFSVDVTAPEALVGDSIAVASGPQASRSVPMGARSTSRARVREHRQRSLQQGDRSNSAYPNTPRAVAQGIVASPDGRRVYVGGGAEGVVAMDAALAQAIPSESIGGFTVGSSAAIAPQALALSPDGTQAIRCGQSQLTA